jgi:hypothetical protein
MRRHRLERSMRAALAVLAACVWPLSSMATERSEVPIRQSVAQGDIPRYWIELSIAGGPPIRAMLDTGSSGLRVLANVGAPPGAAPTNETVRYGYTSGAEFSGPILTAPVTIGRLTTPPNFRLHLIETAACNASKPECPVSHTPPEAYRIGGRGKEGFTAILGTNMGRANVGNPLSAVADVWIIELPRPRSREPGRLILNPAPDEQAGFERLRLDPVFEQADGNFHDAVAGCVVSLDDDRSICGPTLLDSGAPVIEVSLGAGKSGGPWGPGVQAAIAFPTPSGAPLAARFVTGRDQPSKLLIHEGQGQPRDRISAGSLPFYAFSVLYDPKDRILGLKPRQAATEKP